MVLYAGYCGGCANRIHCITGYRHARTLVDVGEPVVYVFPPVKPANQYSKDYWILDDCQCGCDWCGRIHYPDRGMAVAVAFTVAL